MGLLDMAKSMLDDQPGSDHALTDMLGGIIGNQGTGGLNGLLQKFKDQGLHDVVASWVGTGQNLPISTEQLKQVLGSEQIQDMAAKLGISRDALSSKLSQLLPQVVDKLTPGGTVPEHSTIESGLAMLKSVLN